MSSAATASNSKCICPHRTADAVALVRNCVGFLGEGFKPHGGGSPIDHVFQQFSDALKRQMTPGVVLLTTQHVQIIDHPVSGGTLRVLPDGGYPGKNHGQIKHARETGDYISSSNRVIDENNRATVERVHIGGPCIILTTADNSSGQLSHPSQLLEELELISGAWRQAAVSDALGFLAALEEACRNAHANGSTNASVAVYHTVSGQTYRAVHGADQAACDVQAERALPGSKCVSIRVRQHEEVE